ncbi:hypothetical protein NKI74_06110 [Mesorhizobium sp. M0494]|uniref:hypothetical protein n=1 Tax=Mesorhizobium sp. M0494 TaxID=2956951 RepID=UPI00333AC5DB
MNIATRFAAAMIGTSLLAGCTTLTEGEFNTMHTTLEGSPVTKRVAINECIAPRGPRRSTKERLTQQS